LASAGYIYIFITQASSTLPAMVPKMSAENALILNSMAEHKLGYRETFTAM
jgi:hypothetical protein